VIVDGEESCAKCKIPQKRNARPRALHTLRWLAPGGAVGPLGLVRPVGADRLPGDLVGPVGLVDLAAPGRTIRL
jgi:hypothetical protein